MLTDKNYPEFVDLEEIECLEVAVVAYNSKPMATVLQANISDILESIGEDVVRKYFNIPEEE